MSSKYIDRKVTVWERYYFDENTDLKNVIEELETTGKEIQELEGFVESEILFDTSVNMEISENDGAHTIEVYENNNECIWDNVRKFDTNVG